MKSALMPSQSSSLLRYAEVEDLPNFSEAGTGKTITTLAAIEQMGLQTGLVIGPTISLQMWVEEIEKELGANVQLVKTSNKKLDKLADFHVCSYTIATKRAAEFAKRNFGALVLDESHYLRSRDSQRTQAIFGEDCDGAGGIYEGSKYCFSLTGTPIERYADDLWSQLRAIQPEALQKWKVLSFEDFANTFAFMEWVQYNAFAPPKWRSKRSMNEDILNKLLYEEIKALRWTLAEVAPELPPRSDRLVTVAATLPLDMITQLKGQTEAEIIDKLVNGNAEMATIRQRLGLLKVASAAEYIADQAQRGPILVGCWHIEVIGDLKKALSERGLSVGIISGETGLKMRQTIQNRFNSGDLDVLVGQTRAMGVSLNLQSVCRHVVILEDDWLPSVIDQFVARVLRKGQESSHVQVDFLASDSPIDKAIRASRLRKAASANKVVANRAVAKT